MIVNLGRAEPGCLDAAVYDCSLQYGASDEFFINNPVTVPEALATRVALGRPDRVVRLKPNFEKMMSRRPSEAAIYIVGDEYFAVWDDRFDGFGINAFLGPAGHRLFRAYVAALSDFYLAAFGPAVRRVEVDETVTLEYAVDQEKVTVRIYPDGRVKIETSGFVGESCLAATAALEKAVGGCETSEPTAEMCQAEENSVAVGT